MPERKRTMADVAKNAGVSTATVSRALNGGLVSAEARARVDAAVRALNYRRNDLARGLVTGRTGVLGVLIPDVIGPLYAQMARGIEDELEPRGMHSMMVTDNRDLEQEAAAIELLLGRQVDGLILIGSALDPERLRNVVGTTLPAVLIQREWHDPKGAKPSGGAGEAAPLALVQIDNAGGIEAAVAHLAARGHRRLAHVKGVRRDAHERDAAFRKAVAAHGLELGPIVASDSTEAGGTRAGGAVVADEAVDGVVCSNDRIAAGLYPVLKGAGRAIPDDVSVTGFDDLPWSAYLDPPLTTVRQPARTMGRIAARQLLTALGGGEAPSDVTVPTRLVERASVRTGGRRGGERRLSTP